MPMMIDLTPTWGDVGEMYIRFAESNEQKAIRAMAPEIRKAFAIAQAGTVIAPLLNDEQKAAFNKVMEEELAKFKGLA